MTALEQYFGSLLDKRVGVIGAGVSNMPLIRMLRAAGVQVTVHDKKDPTELEDRYATLATLGVDFVLGAHYLDALDEDVIFRTPGVHPRFLEKARANGSEITSEMELFFTVCPCPIIGVTGSDGKTTTTTLVSEMLKHAGYTVYLGGNIGTPLLPHVNEMQPGDLAVVELSSFQLMGMKHSPHVAAITNLSPNHLDYHKDFDEYVQAKTEIYRSQQEGDRLVLNLDDEVTRSLHASGNLFCTSKTQELANGVFLKDDMIYIAKGGMRRELMPAADIRIPGAHNVYNMMMAAAVVQSYVSDDDIRAVATTFGGVEHRIEFVREKDGVKYYNDSIASSPSRTKAGLESFQQKVILIAGGYDKHLPYDVLGEPICEHVKLLILTGATAPKIRDCVLAAEGEHPPIIEVESLEAAVQQAYMQAQPGDIVIMSPASASFDRFRNFMERGKLFKALVADLK
nr:UDP-N-acetylmuramoyl-L-alanine--D-glutamate ligase [uncultured Agathobaculum sp.]